MEVIIWLIVIVCVVVVIEGAILLRKNSDKFEIIWYSIGGILIGVYSFSMIVGAKTGEIVNFFPIFLEVTSISSFFWELSFYLGYNLVFILGVVCVIVGAKVEKTRKDIGSCKNEHGNSVDEGEQQ